MTKKLFIEAIEQIKKQREKEDKFCEALDVLSPDTNNDTFLFNDYEELVVELLEEGMNDEEVISWWIYDCNMGKDKSLTTLYENGKEIDLSSVEKLYDYLASKENK